MKRNIKKLAVFVMIAAIAMFTAVAMAWDGGRHEEQNRGAVQLLKIIPIPGTLSALIAFDISWIDADTQLYYLADRSNAAIDVVDAKKGTFLKTILGGFKGFTGSNNTSGPNGVTVSGHFLFVTDAPSRVVSIDLKSDTIINSVTTGTTVNRADELAYDPKDGILLAVNNADDPPFATLISVNKTSGFLTLGQRITFDKTHAGFDATNGAEQPVWDPGTGKFYLSIPEKDCPTGDPRCGGSFPDGAVVRIDPHAGVDGIFPVDLCQPAGLTLGPKQDLLIGCSQAFDTDGNAWSATDKKSAAPISVIMDARTGKIDRNVAGVSGNDEVWFNKGDGRYYLAARNQPGGPVLGVIDAESQTLVQLVPTVNKSPGSAHSVAVNPHNNHAFVPLPANNVFPNCLNGCFAVFGAPDEDYD